MLTPFSIALRTTMISRGVQFRFSNLLVTVSVRKSFHSFTPALNTLVEKKCLCTRATTLPLQTATKYNFVTKSSLQSNSLDAALFSRGFSTSRHQLAKELSDKGDVVYRGAISGMIRGVKIFSLSTSILGICLQPMLLFSNQELPTGLKFAIGGFINFFVFMNPFIIHYIAKKYVTELRWNRTTGVFTAATWSVFVQRKELQFTADDVKVPDVPGMFTFLEAKGTPLFLDAPAFEDNEAYIHLMGFNKPLDWELPNLGKQSRREGSQKT